MSVASTGSRLSKSALRVVRLGFKSPEIRASTNMKAALFSDKFDTTGSLTGPLAAIAEESTALTEDCNNAISACIKFNPLREATRHFKDVNYLDGDEDNAPSVPWEFFQKQIKDPDVVPIVKSIHEDVMTKIKAIESQSVEEEFRATEDFFNRVHGWMSEFIQPMEKMLENVDDDYKRVKTFQQEARELTTDELWAKEPKMAAAIRSEWDNDRWAVKSDHPE